LKQISEIGNIALLGCDNQICSSGVGQTSIVNRKPGYLAVLIVDTLKENGWTADAIQFPGVEIINESGIL